MEAKIPDSSSGNYSLPPGYLAITGQVISASQHNPSLEDLGAAMTRRVMRDGRTPMLGNLQMNGYRITGAADADDPQDLVTLAQVQALIGMFPGFMQVDTVTSTAAPNGWVYANGQSLSRTTYAALWTRVQAGNNLAATQAAKTHGQYGPGDGATTFTLPNLYADDGYFIRPMASGRTIGSVQADEIKSHTHTGSTDFAGSHSHEYIDGTFQNSGPGWDAGTGRTMFETTRTTAVAGEHKHSFTTHAAGGAETRPRNIAYPVLIKT